MYWECGRQDAEREMTLAYETKLVLIDGHSILNRAFYGMPDLTSSAGLHTGAVYGFLKILFKILEEEKPQYLTVAFDVHAPTFRHEAYADYKGTRHPMPDELREQVPLIKKVLKAMGVVTCEQAGLEADDILGTLAKKAQAEGIEVSLVSGDRDLLQIADEHIQIRIPKTQKGQTTILNYYAKDVQETLGVTPLEFIQVKALQGDTADNIPGVPKVGPKTATDLIVKYHSVDGVYAHLSEITRKSLHDNLEQNEDKARLSLFLAAIKIDAPVELDLEGAQLRDLYTPEAFKLYTELGFKNLLTKFSRETAADAAADDGQAGALEAAGDDLPWAAVFPLMDPAAPGDVPESLRVSALAVFEDGKMELLPAKENGGGEELTISAAGELVTAGRAADTSELTERLTRLRGRHAGASCGLLFST